MPDIAAMGATTYRDYETDGVPSSGIRRPPKSEVRDLYSAIADEIQTAKDSANLSFQGAWDSGTTYQIGMSVSYSGSSYASRIADNVGNQPDISPTQWQVLGLQGAAGSTGPAGADGQLVVDRWVATAFANGSTVSPTERNARRDFYQTISGAGIYDLLDDFAILAGEDSIQALITGKRRTLMTAMNSPVLTRRGVLFTAGSSQYIKTGFIPSTHATQMTGSVGEFGGYAMGKVANASMVLLGCYESTNKRLEMIPATGGNAWYFGYNAPPSAFGTNSDSTGLNSVYRNGTTFGSRKNGAASATYTPGSNATVLPGIELYIGARNANGTPDNYYTGVISFVYWGGLLSVAQTTILYNALQTYFAAVGALDTYVSTGGSDNNAGDAAHPYASWDKGYANTQPGYTMWLDGTTGSPQTHKSTAGSNTTIAKAITVRAINTGGAKITSNGATNNALNLAPTGGETVNIIGCVIDPSLNVSAASLVYTVFFSSVATTFTANFTNCTFRGWTGANGYGAYGGANVKANVKFDTCTFIGDDMRSAINLDGIIAGSLSVQNCAFTLTNQNTESYGPIRLAATAAGITVNVKGCTGTSTVKASLTGTNGHYFGFFQNAVCYIGYNNVSVLGPGSPRAAYGFRCSTNNANDATEFAINGSIMEYNTVYLEPGGGGGGYWFGSDGYVGDKSKADGCISRFNKLTVSAAWGTAGGHGDFGGYLQNYSSYGNTVIGGGINFVRKNLSGTLYDYDNVSKGNSSTGYLYKGSAISGGYVGRNKCTLTIVSNLARCIGLTRDTGGSGVYTSGITIDQFECFNVGGTSIQFVFLETGSSGTFTGNTYLDQAGTRNAGGAFTNGASSYTTMAAWVAAKGATDVANFA